MADNSERPSYKEVIESAIREWLRGRRTPLMAPVADAELVDLALTITAHLFAEGLIDAEHLG